MLCAAHFEHRKKSSQKYISIREAILIITPFVKMAVVFLCYSDYLNRMFDHTRCFCWQIYFDERVKDMFVRCTALNL